MRNKKTILIIEDNIDIREGTTEILELTGRYDVITAENGRVGVDLATRHIPDLILCDIMMPELDGYGVLFMLSKIESTAKIPFIFLTAKAERADMRKAMEMGADDYLTKPFDDVELMNAIDVRLKRHEQLAADVPREDDLSLSAEEQVLLLQELLANSRVKTVKKKQSIYEKDDSPTYVYFVKSGQVRSFKSYKDGRELSTGIFIAGNYFGYASILLNDNYEDYAEAVEPSEIVLIPKDSFLELLWKKPAIASKFIKLLSVDLREKEEQLLGFAYHSVRKRVANALISVAEKSGININEVNACTIDVTRDGLASIAGTANETVSRMLSDFKEEKLISKEKGKIYINSIKNLRDVKQ
ncbi:MULTISPECIES: response regulator [Sphingobacterium]|uniref:response regulator n=1 Tax=Sphingobacterium TaxID=28453 RepID=UPI0006274DC3|nr:response regulator [Sphingobacterium sp. Ag1]KKO92764.1 transcriptional regulator [Sphingobacterium sp. Ag1]